jgi:glycosyltransferase involved in cell wall biosynthesis
MPSRHFATLHVATRAARGSHPILDRWCKLRAVREDWAIRRVLNTEIGLERRTPRLAFLITAYYSYRVPLFEELHRHFKDRFLVITLRRPSSKRPTEAQHPGAFPRELIRGWTIRFRARRFEAGKATSVAPTIAPGLARSLLRFRPDVVISSNLSTWTLTSILLGYRTIIFWEGTFHTERTAGRLRMRLRRWMAKRASAFVTNGTLARDYIEHALGVASEQIFQGGLGSQLPPQHLACVPRAERPAPPIRFLFVGEILFRKGVSHLLYATRLLLERGYSAKDFQVTLLGEGAERARMEQLSAQLATRNVVRFAGGVPSSQVWQFYRDCNVFVLPTLHDNWPLVAHEAMLMAKPILLSKYAGSAADLVHPGENGFTFDPEDHPELARLMARYIEQPMLVTAHGSRSRDIVQAYTPTNVAKSYIKAVDYVLRPSSGEEQVRGRAHA